MQESCENGTFQLLKVSPKINGQAKYFEITHGGVPYPY